MSAGLLYCQQKKINVPEVHDKTSGTSRIVFSARYHPDCRMRGRSTVLQQVHGLLTLAGRASLHTLFKRIPNPAENLI